MSESGEFSVIIHVRFNPAGGVIEIGERPAAANPHQWFDLLTEKAGDAYQALSGGRGVFRVSRDQVEALKSSFTVH